MAKKPDPKTPAPKKKPAAKKPPAPKYSPPLDMDPTLVDVEFNADRALVFEFRLNGKQETITVTDYHAALDRMIEVAKEAKVSFGMK